MLLTIALVLLTIVIISYYAIRHHKYWERKGVNQRFVVPFLGDNFQYIVNNKPFYEMVLDIYKRNPGTRYTGVYQFYTPVLMLTDPELIKQMCVRDFEHFLDHSPFLPEDSDPLWNKNLFSLRGQKWKDMRATLSPSFTGSKMRQMFHLIHECAQNFTNYFVEKSEDLIEIELKDAFTRYTNDTIASTAFGIKCDSLKERDNEFFVRGRQTTDLSGFWRNIKFALVVFIPWLGKFIDGNIFDKDVSKFFRKIVKETLDYREKNNVERPDMINLLMNARKGIHEENEKIEDNHFATAEEHFDGKASKRKMDLTLDDITAQALIFFFAGFETVSTTMCFMAHELAVNPDIQQRLMQELDEFRASHKKLTYEDLGKLPYLDMVFSETLRKWPSTLATDRICVKPYTIKPENPEEKPVDIECKNLLWVPIFALHRDPKYWENPEKFDPERFSPENKDKIVPYSYLPFGVGPRNCIGSRFAIMEVKVVYYTLLEHFEIVPIEKSAIPFVPSKRGFTMQAENGYWFGLKRRKTTNL